MTSDNAAREDSTPLDRPAQTSSLWQTIRDSGKLVELTAGDALSPNDGFLIEAATVALFSQLDGRPICVGLKTAGEFVGLTQMICVESSPFHAVVVSDGAALRFSRSALRRHWETSAFFRDATAVEARRALDGARRWSACQQRHSMRQRLAALIAEFDMNGPTDTIHVSQETVGHILNVRRTTVTATAAGLEEAGAIKWRRGGARIVDGGKLKAAACSCLMRARRSQSSASCDEQERAGLLQDDAKAHGIFANGETLDEDRKRRTL